MRDMLPKLPPLMRLRGGLPLAQPPASPQPIPQPTGSADRDLGDHARDGRTWDEAARHYRGHLDTHPEDGPIWVQFGHALKEQGHHAPAEAAYRTAAGLLPDDSDLFLQLGNLLRLVGRRGEAIEAYAKALRLDASSPAYQELAAMGQRTRADRLASHGRSATPTPTPTPTTYMQIIDLLNFLRAHKTPSGIQRVQLGIIGHSLSMLPQDGASRVEFVFNTSDDLRVWQVDRQRLQDMLDYLYNVNVDHAALRQLIDAACTGASLVRPGAGDSFIILGAFWGTQGTTPLLASLRAQGVTLGCYVYDLIPITHPEYCVQELTVSFTQGFCEALCLLDFIVAISEYTASEVRRFIERQGFPPIPVQAVPLAHSLTGSLGHAEEEADEWTAATATLQGRDYVMCVCTIEIRKNHRYIYEIWKMLRAEGIPVPELVFVGRKGWHMDDFMFQLEASGHLDGTVHIVHDLSDAELQTLYRNCVFTVFPSLVEGWGLPVGESLVYGKLCVASGTSSMPEVGGDLVAYIDPLNLRSGLETCRLLLTEPHRVKEWEARIRDGFTPRTWDDVARDFLAVVGTLHEAVPMGGDRSVSARLDPGETFEVSSLSQAGKAKPAVTYAKLQRLVVGQDWYSPENFGAWMKESSGHIRFTTALQQDEAALLYLRVTGAPNAGGVTLSVETNQEVVEVAMHANRPEWVWMRATAGKDGTLSAAFRVRGHYDKNSQLPRVFCIGLISVAFAPEGDALSRIALLERSMLDAHTRLPARPSVPAAPRHGLV